MERLTPQQRLQIVQLYYENGRSVKSFYRALRPIYGVHNLASVDTSKKYIKLKDLGETNIAVAQLPDNSSFLKTLISKAKENQLDSQLSRHNFVLESRKLLSLSVHQLLLNF